MEKYRLRRFARVEMPCLQQLDEVTDLNSLNFNAIFVLGRGIQFREDKWEPTDWFGYGEGKYGKHDGAHHPEIDQNHPDAIVKGSMQNIVAGVEVLQKANKIERVIFVGGIPSYLQGSGVSEGEIMKDYFKQLCYENDLNQVQTKVIKKGISTYSDIGLALSFAYKKQLNHIAFLSIESHLPKVRQYTKKILFYHPILSTHIQKVSFINSWSILENKNSDLKNFVRDLRLSNAETRFHPLENDAILKIRTGGPTTTEPKNAK